MGQQAKKQPWNPLLKSYPESEKINSVSFEAETMYTRLIAQCDDNANYYGDPKLILAYLFGHRMANGYVTYTSTLGMRGELVSAELIHLYRVDGRVYCHIPDCKKHLRADINRDVRFPEFSEDLIVTPDMTAKEDAPTPDVDVTDTPRIESVPSYTDTNTDTNSNSSSPAKAGKRKKRKAAKQKPKRKDEHAEAYKASFDPFFDTSYKWKVKDFVQLADFKKTHPTVTPDDFADMAEWGWTHDEVSLNMALNIAALCSNWTNLIARQKESDGKPTKPQQPTVPDHIAKKRGEDAMKEREAKKEGT